MAATLYGDISPRTAAYAAKELLTRATPYLVLEKFLQAKPLPENSSKTIKFRRYNSLGLATTPLTEGVTPASTKVTYSDVTATVDQYGSIAEITDVIQDTHEDPVLREITTILSEQAAQTVETIRYNVIKAGTNVGYTGTAALRTAVVATPTIGDFRTAIRTLKAQNCRPITSIVRSTANFNTENIAPAYVAICHPNLEPDLRAITAFIPAEQYGSISQWENEIGAIEGIRILTTTIFTPWADAGGAYSSSLMSTAGNACDVYPIIILGKDCAGIVPLKGKTAITPTVINPLPSKSDPMGQRGSVSWKTMQTAVILNDLNMYRLESACSV